VLQAAHHFQKNMVITILLTHTPAPTSC